MIIVSEIDAYVDQPNEYKNTRIQEYKKKKLKLKNQRDVSDFEKRNTSTYLQYMG